MPMRLGLLGRAAASATSPEPFASHVDILTAAQDMEAAIHAPSGLAAAGAIRSAQAQVLHAAAYLKLAGATALGARGATLAKQLAALAAAAAGKSGATLAAFQGQTLYAFQGQLRSFNAAVRALGHRGAAVGSVSLGRPAPRRGRGLFATSGVLTITPGQAVALPVTVTVSASFPVYWSCAVQAVDQSGAVMAQATKQASGSASFDLTLGPLSTAGAQVSFRGTLNAYADAAMTQAIPGSPATASTGVEVAVQSATTGPVSATASPASIAPGTLTVGQGFTLNVGVNAAGAGTVTLSGGLYSGSSQIVALTTRTASVPSGISSVAMSGGAVPGSASGMTLTPMVSVNGGSLQASGLVVQVNTVAGTSGPSSAPSLNVTYNQGTGAASASWSAVSGASAYEVQVLNSNGTPVANPPAWGNGTITYDPQGYVGFWTAATSGVGGLPGVGTWGVRVRGSAGIGKTAAVGPWSNVASITVSGVANIIQTSGLIMTPISNGLHVATAVTNIGTGPGVFEGWTAVAFGQDPREAAGSFYVWGVYNQSLSASLAVGQTYPIAFNLGLGNPGAGNPAPAQTYYVAFYSGPGMAGYYQKFYVGSYLTPPVQGPPGGAVPVSYPG